VCYKSDNTEDAGGAPVMVSDLWIEGGLYPINSTINGYSVNNVFLAPQLQGLFLGAQMALLEAVLSTTVQLLLS
jgi:hypothetical protein